MAFIAPLFPVNLAGITGNEINSLGLANYFNFNQAQNLNTVEVDIIASKSIMRHNVWFIASFIWIAIVVIFTFIFVKTVLIGLALRRKAKIVTSHNYSKVYVLPQGSGCFTFLNSIYIGSDLYNLPNRELLLSHEEAHVNSFHYVDLLIAQLVLSVQWFNPTIYIISRELKVLHEFSADKLVIDKTQSQRSYLTLLLEHCHSLHGRGLLVNQFSYGCLKKRITMITNKSKFENRNLRYLLTIPFVALAIFVLACTKDDGKINSPKRAETEIPKKTEMTSDVGKVDGSRIEDYDLLKEFKFNPLDNTMFSVILMKGIEYNFRSKAVEGSFVFQFSMGSQDVLIKSINVDINIPLNYTYIPEKTGVFHLKVFEISVQGFCPHIELLLKQ
jgi:beta-lactamase regulating signal transducer with metallopeptidase domain